MYIILHILSRQYYKTCTYIDVSGGRVANAVLYSLIRKNLYTIFGGNLAITKQYKDNGECEVL